MWLINDTKLQLGKLQITTNDRITKTINLGGLSRKR